MEEKLFTCLFHPAAQLGAVDRWSLSPKAETMFLLEEFLKISDQELLLVEEISLVQD